VASGALEFKTETLTPLNDQRTPRNHFRALVYTAKEPMNIATLASSLKLCTPTTVRGRATMQDDAPSLLSFSFSPPKTNNNDTNAPG
jgi:hypothetical protein